MPRDAPSPASRRTLAVLGAGAWGRVLAGLLAGAGHRVHVWTRSEEHARRLNAEAPPARASSAPAREATGRAVATTDLVRAIDESDPVFLVVPNVALPGLLERLVQEGAGPRASFVSCSKGLVAPGLRRPSELVGRAFPDRPIAVLSGPNLASEIAAGLPAAAAVASADGVFATEVQRLFRGDRFRVYTNDDPVGVEVAGAYKNVIALAAGMCDALRLGENAKASLVTRGLAEMVRLGLHLGGRDRTFFGLAGVGDLVATCASGASRNHTAGERLAHGATVPELERERLTAEGLGTVRAVVAEAKRVGLILPIAHHVHAVAFEGVPASVAVDRLLSRDPRAEWDL